MGARPITGAQEPAYRLLPDAYGCISLVGFVGHRGPPTVFGGAGDPQNTLIRLPELARVLLS